MQKSIQIEQKPNYTFEELIIIMHKIDEAWETQQHRKNNFQRCNHFFLWHLGHINTEMNRLGESHNPQRSFVALKSLILVLVVLLAIVCWCAVCWCSNTVVLRGDPAFYFDIF